MKAKKKFGQHFLINEKIAERIAHSATVPSGKVLEVGPGKGVLTKYLLQRDWEVKAVELDKDLIPLLRHRFETLEVIQGDFLRIDRKVFFDDSSFSIVGNFPYNISSQILFKAVEWREYVPELVGMFQKEMAQRVVSGPGSKEYGVISVLVQAYFDCEYLFSVGPGNFAPPPKVQSGVIRLLRKPDDNIGCDDAVFKNVVKTTFNQRRKMLRNTLKGRFPAEVLEEDFFRQRPEQLAIKDFVSIANRISEHKKKTK